MQGELQYVDILSGMSDEGLEVSWNKCILIEWLLHIFIELKFRFLCLFIYWVEHPLPLDTIVIFRMSLINHWIHMHFNEFFEYVALVEH